MSQSGQKLNDIEITNDNISEIMRIFIRSRNGKVDEVSNNLTHGLIGGCQSL